MPAHYWWIWMIAAGIFVVGEIFTAAFFVLWFGVGAAVAGLLALAGAGPMWQFTAFVVVSLVLVAASRRFANRVSREQPPGIGADRVVGQSCVVLEAIDNARNTGRVRLGTEEWRADSESGTAIEPGTTVKVTGVNGTRLIVTVTKEGD